MSDKPLRDASNQDGRPEPTDSETFVSRKKQIESLYAEWREDYAARAKEFAEEGAWQVWHLQGDPEDRMAGLSEPVFPRDFIQVASVPAANAEEAAQKTTHLGDFLKGTGRSWNRDPEVLAHVFVPRSTDAGDMVVDPAGQAYRVERDGFSRLDPSPNSLPSPSEIADQPPAPEGERADGRHFDRVR